MRATEIAVLFEPSGKTVYVLPETPLLEAAVRAGLTLTSPCGGQGTCGKCRVHVNGGLTPPTSSELATLGQEAIDAGERLACQARALEACTVHVADSALKTSVHRILVGNGSSVTKGTKPVITKRHVTIPKPSRTDDRADGDRFLEAVDAPALPYAMLKELPAQLRAQDFQGTIVACDKKLIAFEPGDTTQQSYTVAFDLGTTTIAATLLDAYTGKELAQTASMNPQTRFGDDVLSRILHATDSPNGLKELSGAVREEMNQMLGVLAEKASITLESIYEVTVAGNTSMQQLFAGLDPTALGTLPFVPVTGSALHVAAAALDIHIHPRGHVYVLPVIGGFVGGDTVAGLISSELCKLDGPVLFVDIGTNGEIVLCHDGKLTAASTAAGPAFEGARIRQGMRASAGAIEKVVLNDDVKINVIGDVAPVGLCGSALVDAAAELLRTGILMREGLLLSGDMLPDDTPPALRNRLRPTESGVEFVLANATSNEDQDVALTQGDIRELQLATAAIRAGISIMLRKAGLTPSDLQQVLVAGGFGNFIRRNHAQRIGLLPSNVPHHKISFIGNAALAGASMTAVALDARERASELAKRTEHIDLASSPDFQMEFAEAILFPELDEALS